MKRIIAACAAMFCAVGFAQTLPLTPIPVALSPTTAAQPTGLVEQLQNAATDYEVAAFKASLDQRLAAQKMAINEQVAAVSMSTKDAEHMRELDAIKGPDYSEVTPTGAAWKTSHEKGKQAYRRWIVGRTPAQVADAKKLYAAWLTRLDAMSHLDGDPNNVDQMPAGVAYEQAVNEFNIDNGG